MRAEPHPTRSLRPYTKRMETTSQRGKEDATRLDFPFSAAWDLPLDSCAWTFVLVGSLGHSAC